MKMRPTLRLLSWHKTVVVLLFTFLSTATVHGLEPVTGDWAVKIVQFNVGQADAAVVLTKDRHAAVIDLGETKKHGLLVGGFLLQQEQNGVGVIDEPDYLFISHYDKDHIGGAAGLVNSVAFAAAYEQGPSKKRAVGPRSAYGRYIRLVGDPNGDVVQDDGEEKFVRHLAKPGKKLKLGNDVKITVLSARGDTKGTEFDLDLDPSKAKIDENPGSLMLLVQYHDFEFLTTGDATCSDWKNEPDAENNMAKAHAIDAGLGVDLLKVSHHGSDTGTGKQFIETLKPTVAIISSTMAKDHLPKKTSLMTLEHNGALTLVTGKATDEKGQYHDAQTTEDDHYTPDPTKVLDQQGTVTILVSKDGKRFTVKTEADEDGRTFSSADDEDE
jgi:competence protein ComEC